MSQLGLAVAGDVDHTSQPIILDRPGTQFSIRNVGLEYTLRLFHFPDFSGNVGTEQKCLRFATPVKSAGCEPFQKVARSAESIKYSWLETTFRVCHFYRKSWNLVTLTLGDQGRKRSVPGAARSTG